jgi:hypothetical protein
MFLCLLVSLAIDSYKLALQISNCTSAQTLHVLYHAIERAADLARDVIHHALFLLWMMLNAASTTVSGRVRYCKPNSFWDLETSTV